MTELTSVVADTICRTGELGVTITSAAAGRWPSHQSADCSDTARQIAQKSAGIIKKHGHLESVTSLANVVWPDHGTLAVLPPSARCRGCLSSLSQVRGLLIA